ncbi:restriction endonuclease [Trichocoleus sp. DQ-A3]|uniref:restriction endonuclease n=1 Tax=Cyanophyceae TaxID=3028117 RepID=UPI001685F46C|nr:restriction endonuclease [Coleofasciculus sp. FACHB-125]MBD1900326.1 restriction endonuclease [Coleofasciculus sp. FACHB-125]
MMDVRELVNQISQATRVLEQPRAIFQVTSVSEHLKQISEPLSAVTSISEHLKQISEPLSAVTSVSEHLKQISESLSAVTGVSEHLKQISEPLSAVTSVSQLRNIFPTPAFSTPPISKCFAEFIQSTSHSLTSYLIYLNNNLEISLTENEVEELNLIHTEPDVTDNPKKQLIGTREFITTSPFIGFFNKLKEGIINLDRLHWREFEELVAELLEKDGYNVQLGRGSKDGGADIIVTKELENIGFFKAVWQAKRLKQGNTVDIDVIRLLDYTTRQMKCTKGYIVTNSYLTRDAAQLIERDQHILGKVERNELERWIDKILKRR